MKRGSKMRRFLLLIVLAVFFLTGCGTTGKDITTRLEINDNSGVVNVYPTVETKSGDNTNTSANKTDMKDLVKIPDPLEAAAAKLEKDIVNKTVSNLGKASESAKQEKKKPPEVNPAKVEGVTVNSESIGYETRYHHTTTGSSDHGKSIVLCPGQVMDFAKCSAGDVDLPRHDDTGRQGWWNMTEEPVGDIVCEDGSGKKFRYKADAEMVEGNCS